MRGWQILAVAAVLSGGAVTAADPPAGFPKFQPQQIDAGLEIGYGVILEDLNGDGKTDIVVADKHRVLWYENPTWKRRTLLAGKTKPDNVCLCALDIDGGGDLEIVLGANWNAGTKVPGTLQWLKRGKSLDDEWSLHPIPCDEPTVHRVRAADLDGDGKPEVIVAPLHGRDATQKGNWTDGRPVRLVAYKVPADPTKAEAWKPQVLSEDLHVMHNFWPTDGPAPGRGARILTASYEGVHELYRPAGGGWKLAKLGDGNQENPKGSRGASEVKAGLTPNKVRFVATVEPWHGNQVVVYTPNDDKKEWERRVLDGRLRWGHAVWCADLDADGADELVIGVRDDPKAGDASADPKGVRVYKSADGWRTWDRLLLDPGGVAVEDLAVADLDADGKPDVVAVGRATKNCRIYWNRGK